MRFSALLVCYTPGAEFFLGRGGGGNNDCALMKIFLPPPPLKLESAPEETNHWDASDHF